MIIDEERGSAYTPQEIHDQIENEFGFVSYQNDNNDYEVSINSYVSVNVDYTENHPKLSIVLSVDNIDVSNSQSELEILLSGLESSSEVVDMINRMVRSNSEYDVYT